LAKNNYNGQVKEDEMNKSCKAKGGEEKRTFGMDLIELAHDRDRWTVPVYTVMNLRTA
jgi:hypothetical protein